MGDQGAEGYIAAITAVGFCAAMAAREKCLINDAVDQ